MVLHSGRCEHTHSNRENNKRNTKILHTAGVAGLSLPLSFPAALAAQGRPHDALLVLRASKGAQDPNSTSPFEDEPGPMHSRTASVAETSTPSSTPQGIMGLKGQAAHPMPCCQQFSQRACVEDLGKRLPFILMRCIHSSHTDC